jgi:hypothetical protein
MRLDASVEDAPDAPSSGPGQFQPPIATSSSPNTTAIDAGAVDARGGADAGTSPRADGGTGGATGPDDTQEAGGTAAQGAPDGRGGQSAGADDACPEGESTCPDACAGCTIDSECVAAGTTNSENSCDICDPARSTSDWSPNDGESCNDGQFCTVEDVCDGSTCVGTGRGCDDGIACNGVSVCDEDLDQCVPGQGQCGDDICDLVLDQCVSVCDGCLIGDQCVPDGQEKPGNPCLVCDVGVAADDYSAQVGKLCGQGPATCSGQDTCDAKGVCQPNDSPMGTACGSSSSSACDGADTCDGSGACSSNVAPNGTNCDDGQYCTQTSECQGGQCVGTSQRSCAPNQQCDEQNDACICPGCTIGQSCIVQGTVNPSNSCQVCTPSSSTTAYSPNVGATCGAAVTECSSQDTCDASGVCQANDLGDGTPCSIGECNGGVCEVVPNPFDCVAPDPPDVVLPDDVFLVGGSPPTPTGGTIPDGVYTPVRVDLYGSADQVTFTTFEFYKGYVQIGLRAWVVSAQVAFIPQVEFAGSYTTSGTTLTWDVERCDPQYTLDPPELPYTVTANGLLTFHTASGGDTAVVSYLRN